MDSREGESVSALPQVELVGRVKLIDLSAVRDVWVLSADEDAELQRPVGPHHDKYHQWEEQTAQARPWLRALQIDLGHLRLELVEHEQLVNGCG